MSGKYIYLTSNTDTISSPLETLFSWGSIACAEY